MSYTLYNSLKRALAVCISAALLAAMSGCAAVFADYREIATLMPVQTLGFDSLVPTVSATISTGKGIAGEKAAIISRESDSIPSCLEALQDYSAKNDLFFEQTRFVLLGEDAARAGLGSFFDFIKRANVLRFDNPVFIVRGGTAKELVSGSGAENYDVTESLATIVRDSRNRGEGYSFNCREVLRSLNEYGGALACAVAVKPLEGSVFDEDASDTAVPAGFAIIKGDSLVGYIDRDDCALGANLLLGKGGAADVSVSDGQGGSAQLELTGTSCSWSAEWDGGQLRSVTASLCVGAKLSGTQENSGNLSQEYLSALEDSLSKETVKHASRVLARSQSLSCDFLGIAGELRKIAPAEYAKLSRPFPEELSAAVVNVRATAEISGSFIKEPPFFARKGA